ncbi:uncharacterized protein LAESUDRAFT_116199 [Laetiporus sulphureus 93-53]|uniref:Uncharacterized protein n=1 Tax=Laetiporus sulphureus 93-53 TaxID=1314785 RepID=A0A165EQW4_9APHY|nr:uncharacterized protein LAESUDRAFT_116199 [Laetiporus sulphureus 93-53]KZT07571.1 hypothetical protein LAESUDRAFT_116199 [Laetiporus sulphureus 93-53]
MGQCCWSRRLVLSRFMRFCRSTALTLSVPSARVLLPSRQRACDSRRIHAPISTRSHIMTTGFTQCLPVDLPPSKRRRTLVSSIAGTALSAALIGTAMGLTAYRIWKDWGKQPRLELPSPPPPPPYEQGEWMPPKLDPIPANVVQVAPSSSSSAATRSRKLRYVAGSRRTTRHHKSLSRTSHVSVASSSSISAYRASIPSDFTFTTPTEPEMDAEVDDQVLWMNDRLASLIAEGQRALGKEVVVMSETQEDEEDDGAGGWVEEDTGQSTSSSYARSARTSWSSGLPPYSSPSPRQLAFDFARSPRVESDAFAGAGYREDESSWQTPELREAMARARDMYKRERT